MSNLHQPTGPSPEFFRRLKDQLPSFREEVEKKRVRQGQTPVADMVPKKVCSVCGKGFDWGPIKGPIPDLAVCDKCSKRLAGGDTALKSDNRFAFIKSESLADKAGEIMEVSPQVMDQVQKHYLAEWVEGMADDAEKKSQEQKPNETTDPSGDGQNPKLN